jgi:formylglycine-generating enzyme required for sulfatase activity
MTSLQGEEPVPSPSASGSFMQTQKPLMLIGGIGGAIVLGLVLAGIAVVALVLLVRSIYNGATPANVEQPANVVAKQQAPPSPPAAPPEMAYVEGGEFVMGRDGGEIPEEQPAHTVTVKPFFMDIYEVTNEEYAAFVRAMGHKTPQGWKGGNYPAGEARYPVVGVNWNDAVEFAKWKGKRLPTEEEWEFAARGKQSFLYPWGNEWTPKLANVDGASRSFAEVGQFPGKSPYGMYDMVGNAGEWTSNDFKAYPNGHLSDMYAGKTNLKTRRGSDYAVDRNFATTTFRFGYPATGADYNLTGFRCAKDIGN